jgi:mono/diheme cytochrome c family protein
MKKYLLFLLAGCWLVAVLLPGPAPVRAQSGEGQSVYQDKCAMCHGQDGKGNGPAAAAFNPAPADFTNPGFWQGNVRQKITATIENGHGPMPAIELSSSQIKAVIDYMSRTFK